MKLQPWAGVEQYLVMLIVVVPSIYSRSECPEDVRYSANRCFDSYNDHVRPDQIYYSGIDVEALRAICNALSQSIRCVIELTKSCPDYNQHDISSMTVFAGPVVGVLDLCDVDNIFEKYAPHQFCYTNLKPSTDICRETFTSEMSSLDSSEPQDPTQFCSHLTTLVSCVRSHVENTCGPVAASLAEPLVRASVGPNDHCQKDLQESATQQMTTLSVTRTTTARGGLSHNQVGDGAHRAALSLAAILLLVSLSFFNLIINH